jgi:hypothetical protein
MLKNNIIMISNIPSSGNISEDKILIGFIIMLIAGHKI